MRPRNTLSKVEFILDHIFWGLIAWIWYKTILFRCLDQHSLKESKWILVGFVSVYSVLGLLLEWKRQRNQTSILMNLLAGYGIYAVLTYIPIRWTLILVTLITAVILATSYFLYVLLYRIRRKRITGKVLIRRIRRACLGSRNIICSGFALIMVLIGLKTGFETSVVNPSAALALPVEIEEQTIANNLDTLVLLEEDAWERLSVGDRLNVLQVMANIERRYLGLPHELNVGTLSLREGVAGCYSDEKHEILVNIDCLLNDSPDFLVKVIAHEAYHAAQFRMVDAYDAASDEAKSLILFYDASVYKEEFASYVDASGDYCEYYYQKCETDARKYAEEAVIEYYARIEEYLDDRTAHQAAVANNED